MSQTTFEIDEKTIAALDRLKQVYGLSTNAAVLRRALAIALVAAEQADSDYNIHLYREDSDGKKEFVLPQRY